MDRTNTRKLTVFGTLIIVLSFCYDVSSQDYRILVTNDDGIDSLCFIILSQTWRR